MVAHFRGASQQPEEWYVLPFDWLLRYALTNPDSVQHAVHAVECFQIPRAALPNAFLTLPANLQAACEKAITDVRTPNSQSALRLVTSFRGLTGQLLAAAIKLGAALHP